MSDYLESTIDDHESRLGKTLDLGERVIIVKIACFVLKLRVYLLTSS